jgi:hypothetical protein
MSNETKHNDSAHPYTYTGYNNGLIYSEDGLTKREYFAAMAMQGLCANQHPLTSHDNREIANYAVCQADALIEALNNMNP